MGTNVVVISGRLTADAEVRSGTGVKGNGYDITSFTLAFDVGWGDREHAVFVPCKWWGKGGSSIISYLTKGKKVTVTGSWDREEWTTNEGQKRQKDLILVTSVELGGSPFKEDSKPEGVKRPSKVDYDDIPF